jgi:hypothetical protein
MFFSSFGKRETGDGGRKSSHLQLAAALLFIPARSFFHLSEALTGKFRPLRLRFFRKA